jgi:hypothetical protein
MQKTDPFLSVLRESNPYSKGFLRSNSPPDIVRISLEREKGKLRSSTSTPAVDSRVIISSKPPMICVHCSKPSSICMLCNEISVKNALNFQRKGSALGAIEFFKKAVKEAGQKRLAKLMVFRIWKNGFKMRAVIDKRINSLVNKMFLKQVATEPFHAWRRLIQTYIKNRRQRHLDDLKTKVLQLEEMVKKLSVA